MIEPVQQTSASVRVLRGDCVEVMREMPDNSIDSCVTDPPSGISFMGKSWDSDKGGRTHWVAWLSEVMAEVLRVVKPGGHALVWALPRTSHWTALALEDAGWEVRDRISHVFGSGFPKSKNLGNGQGSALKPATEDWWLVRKPLSEKNLASNVLKWGTGGLNIDESRVSGAMGPDRANVKPSRTDNTTYRKSNPEINPQSSLGRFPANLLLSHVGPDENGEGGCRQVGSKRVKGSGWAQTGSRASEDRSMSGPNYDREAKPDAFTDPDGTEEVPDWECEPQCAVRLLDEQSGELKARGNKTPTKRRQSNGVTGWGVCEDGPVDSGNAGGASRFFETFPGFYYSPKASKRERAANGRVENNHPTVKSLALMKYLCKLVTPPGGTVLDCFAGSGTTGVAALSEGFNAILIEQDEEYSDIAEARCAYAMLPESERVEKAKPAKARNTYGFKSTDVLRRCPEHNESIPSGSTTYKCGCAKVWYKVESEAEEFSGRLPL